MRFDKPYSARAGVFRQRMVSYVSLYLTEIAPAMSCRDPGFVGVGKAWRNGYIQLVTKTGSLARAKAEASKFLSKE